MSNVIDSWTLNYRPEGGGRIMGSLAVTDEAVEFSSEDLDDDIVVPRADIELAEAAKRGLFKQVVIRTKGGQSYVFEYGLLSVKKIVDLIQSGA